ncbi:hypothetical protein L4G92_03130 [Neisseria sp. ZJ106]|uniref:DUF4142 domain-containing protein n=1 Tax=Neisseria lisongii TaxID=2912188 RepID=A0ABY7RKY5_9NEIS|nr:hypothetical protein [Neisseria lisongii]MCF7521048.1 hypothetical protein [Neisseria lisongii]WCL71978.1 hypothetical protein PJU73_02350 [Neisseria lisongii]
MKRLKDISAESREYQKEANKVVDIHFQNDEATKRLVMRSAKRVIAAHKAELEKLAYK